MRETHTVKELTHNIQRQIETCTLKTTHLETYTYRERYTHTLSERETSTLRERNTHRERLKH